MDTINGTPPAPPRRRWVAFSVRGILALVLAIGLWLGWVVNAARNKRIAVVAIEAYGGFVYYDHEFVGGKLTPGTEPWGPRWLHRWLGDDYFQDVAEVSLVYGHRPGGARVEVSRTTDDVVVHLRAFPRLKRLLLHKTQATDAAMEHVGRLAKLEGLWMWDAAVTDEGVARLEGLRHLKDIHVSNAKITDASLRTLAQLPRLETLSLQGNYFTDAGLVYLKGMRDVKGLYLGLGHGEITDAGLDKLVGFDRLAILDIQGSKITDAGLDTLGRLPGLKELWASNTKITREAVEKLKAEKPGFKGIW